MARIVAAVKDPNEVEVSLTITMSLSRWKRLREQITTGSAPGWWLDGAIRKTVNQVEKQITEDADVSP